MRNKHQQRGFSLTEVLVALAIMGVSFTALAHAQLFALQQTKQSLVRVKTDK